MGQHDILTAGINNTNTLLLKVLLDKIFCLAYHEPVLEVLLI